MDARPIVLSASRRTDIPAFYLPWLIDSLDRGLLDIPNPYSGKLRRVTVSPQTVHCIVLWSKNFGPMLDAGLDLALQARGYRLAFQFTINGPQPLLEPAVPPLEQRLEQLRRLCDRYGPAAVRWRFDPICHWHEPTGGVRNNLTAFATIADAAAACGIQVCITSFVDLYAKVVRRGRAAGIGWIDPPVPEKAAIAARLAAMLHKRGMALHTCCESQVLEALGPDTKVQASACIDARWLADLFPDRPPPAAARDRGQRTAAGCRCTVSVDVGDYRAHRCRHGCRFCYANPAEEADTT